MDKISFKISKNGTRYYQKPKSNPSVSVDDGAENASATSSVIKHYHQQLVPARVQCDYDFSEKGSVVDLTEDDDDEDTDDISDEDVSFIVNIFLDGYTIDKTLESVAAQKIALMYDPKLLRPYDRESQSLFKAIECCRVPANFFEDIPCKYKNGKVMCEVRDWRKDSSEQAGASINNRLSVAAIPSIKRVSLKMSVNSIVRDIPQMSKRDFWAYSELLETEAKILLELYPKLDLDPYPDFDRLCKKPTTVKLNLDFLAMRRKRLRQTNLGTADQPNVANSSTGQRTVMGPPNVVNVAAQNVGQIPTTHQLTQNVPRLPTLDQLTRNARQIPTMNQLTQNVGPSRVNHVPSTSVPRFPWESPQSHALAGTAFNAPAGASSSSTTRALVNLSSGEEDIDSFMSGFECHGRGNRGSRLHNAVGASSSARGASSTRAMQISSSSIMPAFDRNWSDPLALIGNNQQMTLETLDNTPGTAFNRLRAANTRSVSLPSANDGRRSFTSAFDGRTASQDGQSLVPMAYLDGSRQSNSMVYAARTSVNAPGGSSSNHVGTSSVIPLMKMENENWSNPLAEIFSAPRASSNNNDGISSIIPFDDGKMGNQDVSRSSSQSKIEPHVPDHAQRTAVGAPVGASSTHGTVDLTSEIDRLTSLWFGPDDKSGNQDGQSSSMANADNNENQSNLLANVPEGFSEQSAVNLSPDDDIDIPSILAAINADNNADNNQSNESASVGSQQQPQIAAANQKQADNDCLWSAMSAFDNKRGHQDDGESSSMAKRNRLNPLAFTANQPQQMVAGSSVMDNTQQPNAPTQRQYRFHLLEAISSKPNNITHEPLESDRLHPSFPPQLTRSTFLQAPWNVKEEPMEFSSGLGSSPRRRSSVFASVPAIGGRVPIDVITIEDDEPVERRSSSRPPKSGESSSGAAATPRSKPHLTIPILHGIASSSTVDRRTRDRLTRLELLTARFKLINCKEVKVDDYKPTTNIPSSHPNHALINSNDNETLIDETSKMPLSMSHAGGNVNLCKTRILKFVKEAHSYRAGNEEILVPKSETKLTLSERQSDGTVTMHYCEFDDFDHSGEEELLPTFKNKHTADMFAAEFCALMEREGYTIAGDYIQAKPAGVVQLSDVQHKRAIGPVVIAGNVYGTGLNLGGGNNTVGSEGSGNVRRGVPRAGRKGASPLAQRRSPGQSSEAGSGSGSRGRGSRGRGSRGRGSRGRGSRGRGARGRGSDVTPEDNVNPWQGNVLPPRMALSNTGVEQIGDMNTNSSLISGSGSAGSGSRGLLVSNTSGISMAQRNPIALPRFMTEMSQNRNLMQQQANIQPASVSTSVSRPSLSAANQVGASRSNDWVDDDFMRNLMK